MKKIQDFQKNVVLLNKEALKKIKGGDNVDTTTATAERDKNTPIRPPH